jgi:hypothetical protein
MVHAVVRDRKAHIARSEEEVHALLKVSRDTVSNMAANDRKQVVVWIDTMPERVVVVDLFCNRDMIGCILAPLLRAL